MRHADVYMMCQGDSFIQGRIDYGRGEEAVRPLPHEQHPSGQSGLEAELVRKIKVGIENDYLIIPATE